MGLIKIECKNQKTVFINTNDTSIQKIIIDEKYPSIGIVRRIPFWGEQVDWFYVNDIIKIKDKLTEEGVL